MLYGALGRTKGLWHVPAVRDGAGGARFPCTLVHRMYNENDNRYGGSLWVGGKKAAERSATLTSNGISARCQVIDPARYTLYKRRYDQNVEDHELPVDRAFSGEMPLEEFVNLAKYVVDLILGGEHVLVFDTNGSHRATTLAAATLMMMTGESSATCTNHVWQLRHVADFWSRLDENYTGLEVLQWAEESLHTMGVVATLALACRVSHVYFESFLCLVSALPRCV